jgi:hypothetical protein
MTEARVRNRGCDEWAPRTYVISFRQRGSIPARYWFGWIFGSTQGPERLELRRKIPAQGQQPRHVLAVVVDGVHERSGAPAEDVCRPWGADMDGLGDNELEVEMISCGSVRLFFDFGPNQVVNHSHGVHSPQKQPERRRDTRG